MFDDIVEKLKKYPKARYGVGKNQLGVLPNMPNGFIATIRLVTANNFEVWLDGWHDHFETYKEARECLAFALSNRCRLKRYRKGSFSFRWTLEYFVNGQWKEESTTGLLLFPIWRPTTTDYLQNEALFET
jgi:hypothetical protein